MTSVVGALADGGYDLKRGLALYDPAGDLPVRARELWLHLANDSVEMAREFWKRYALSPELPRPLTADEIEANAQKILPYVALKVEQFDRPEWTVKAKSYVERALKNNISLSTVLAGLASETEAAFAILRRTIADQDTIVRFARTLSEIQSLEIDCFIHHAIGFTRHESEHRQAQLANDFNAKMLGVVSSCTRESDELKGKASVTSASARGMLGKTSEVAAAAEQSATAMREAAQTAAGLIRAIEDARNEVEVAADVALELAAGATSHSTSQWEPKLSG